MGVSPFIVLKRTGIPLSIYSSDSLSAKEELDEARKRKRINRICFIGCSINCFLKMIEVLYLG
jgi:hypothetical protein